MGETLVILINGEWTPKLGPGQYHTGKTYRASRFLSVKTGQYVENLGALTPNIFSVELVCEDDWVGILVVRS